METYIIPLTGKILVKAENPKDALCVAETIVYSAQTSPGCYPDEQHDILKGIELNEAIYALN